MCLAGRFGPVEAQEQPVLGVAATGIRGPGGQRVEFSGDAGDLSGGEAEETALARVRG